MTKTGKELELFKKKLNIDDVSILMDILKSDSVYTLVRYGFKNQEKTGIDNHSDNGFYELYEICTKLRENNIK